MLDGMKKANSKMRVQKHRWNKAKKVRQPTIRPSPKRAATQKNSKSPSFFPGMKTAGSWQEKGIL
jgi:hypothetical protein